MREKVLAVAAVLLCAGSVLASARVSFVRVLPATYDLAPAERLAFIYAIGDSERISDFVMDFIDAADRAGAFHIENAVENNHHLIVDDTGTGPTCSSTRLSACCRSTSDGSRRERSVLSALCRPGSFTRVAGLTMITSPTLASENGSVIFIAMSCVQSCGADCVPWRAVGACPVRRMAPV